MTKREGECSSIEGSDYGSIPQEESIFWDIETKADKESLYLSEHEEEPSQARHCVGPTTPGAT